MQSRQLYTDRRRVVGIFPTALISRDIRHSSRTGQQFVLSILGINKEFLRSVRPEAEIVIDGNLF